MTKNGLIAYTKAVRERIDILRSELQNEIDKASKENGDDYNLSYEGEYRCATKFCVLDDALDDFARWLEGEGDLPAGELVMCKARESELEGWRLQRYWTKGQTMSSENPEASHSGWLYIVPLKYFKPTSTDWRPAQSYNWAKFGEGE